MHAYHLPLAVLTLASIARAQSGFHDAYWDTVDAQGHLTGGKMQVFVATNRRDAGVIPAPVTTLTQTLLPPNNGNRVDLVVVGDGYQAAQLPAYAAQVATLATSFFNREPYLTYQPLFLVHRVDVVSVDSGVDNDPFGVLRNTAMDMEFWCNGIDRSLCIDVVKAYQFANNAPDVDLVLALANSTMYGGAGYPMDDLATCAAGNAGTLEIVRHEFGHALGNLADEYDYGGPAHYSGPEPPEPDVSILTSVQMAASMTKWFRWLGTNDAAFDGLVSTYEGAMYSQFGIYRPTDNSLMRSLNRPFNLPSAESIILQIYRIVRPIDDSSRTTTIYDGTETLFVTPVAPAGNPLAIQWYENGAPIAGATGTTLDLTTLGLGLCPVTVSVTVQDTTPMVRDDAARAQWMTESRSFTVQPAGTGFTNFCVTTPNSAGPGAVMGYSGTSSVAANDLVLRTSGCPPFKTAIYFFGAGQTQVVLGNGFRCVASPFVRFPAIQTDFLGDAELVVDLAHLPNGQVIHSGDVRNFQLWFRDPPGGGASTDTSDGLRVQFCP
ncbi:MAG TPA: M64 family metallopeptidase [Planctomycetota bacterium]|jgi:hypothetical protein|nr:M64 family metallopeptidase [Planctomycetota bacterium]